jgi:MEMO1 family protein
MAVHRLAAVAGSFYPGSARELRRLVESLLPDGREKTRALAVVSPHAGYVYSGPVAAAVFASVEIPPTAVILGPSHRPIRPLFALMDEGVWETPLGPVPVATDLARAIRDRAASIAVDAAAHGTEHSLEVQVPFLRVLRPDISIVPIAVSHRAGYEDLAALGQALAEAIGTGPGSALLVASTDMSHYVSRAEAREKDFLAIDRILSLDPKGLFETVRAEDISMCGFQPVTAVLSAALGLGATKAELIAYATSGDRTGDDREVVGYAGLRIS